MAVAMTEVELDGLSVIQWISAVGNVEASGKLVGCAIDDQVSDELLTIVSVGPGNALQCRLGTEIRRIPFAILAKSTVFDCNPDARLRDAVNEIKPPAQIKFEQAQVTLKRYGFPPQSVTRTDDVPILLSTMIDFECGRLPSDAEQSERYEVLKRTGMLRIAARIVDQWREASTRELGHVDCGIFIKLAYLLRHSGNVEEALSATASAMQMVPNVVFSPRQRSVLATERAAILIDLYEMKRDRTFLAEARRCTNLSWAISPSEEASMVYKRLEMHERD